MKYFLDLGSGLGGASEAFVQDENWFVLRIDNNPLLSDVPRTEIMSYFDSDFKTNGFKWNVIWGSPDCREFSNAYSAPSPIAKREGREFFPDLSQVIRMKAIIDARQPEWWIIENVIGAIPHLTPILGAPIAIHGPFVLWGNIPPLHLHGFEHSKFAKDPHSSNPLRSNFRAKVPLELSEALLASITEQTTLKDWI